MKRFKLSVCNRMKFHLVWANLFWPRCLYGAFFIVFGLLKQISLEYWAPRKPSQSMSCLVWQSLCWAIVIMSNDVTNKGRYALFHAQLKTRWRRQECLFCFFQRIFNYYIQVRSFIQNESYLGVQYDTLYKCTLHSHTLEAVTESLSNDDE